jgi:hypothetical protein
MDIDLYIRSDTNNPLLPVRAARANWPLEQLIVHLAEVLSRQGKLETESHHTHHTWS